MLLLSTDEALSREDLTNMSREILNAYKEEKNGLPKSDYISNGRTQTDYVIFGV